ncbi:MAG: hypothetical protein K940chlam8_00086 [Chlamydiae bacterium]|nr:hypothetical protein [Chlamydiota bacterium]
MMEIQATYLHDMRIECIRLDTKERIYTDGPQSIQGLDEYFSPTDLCVLSLATCVLTMMGLKAKKLGADFKKTLVKMQKEMTKDFKRIGFIELEIFCPNEFSEEEQKALEDAAYTCPVHHSLHPEIRINIEFYWGVHG